MAWFKVDDRLHSSRKILSIPRGIRLAAVGLWTLAGSWSAHEELDGLVPDYMISELGGTPRLAEALVAAGLWEHVPDGDRFHKWSEYQPTRAELEAARAKETERKRQWREKRGTDSGVPTGQTVGSHPESGHPDPTRPDPTPLTKELGAGGSNTASTSDASTPFCSRHPNGTDAPCHACKTARELFDVAHQPPAKVTPIPPRTNEIPAHKHKWTKDGTCALCPGRRDNEGNVA